MPCELPQERTEIYETTSFQKPAAVKLETWAVRQGKESSNVTRCYLNLWAGILLITSEEEHLVVLSLYNYMHFAISGPWHAQGSIWLLHFEL